MPMLYLNVRHTLPMIGIQSQKNTLDSGIQQPQYDQETQNARSNLYATQPKLDIDSYPSRHSYGCTSDSDFARENMERGFEGVQEGTSKHTQMAWSLAEDGPKPGRQVAIEQIYRDMMSIADQNRVLVAQAIPDPEVHFTVGEVAGEPAVGRTTPHWNVTSRARVEYNRGNIEIYLQQKGSIRAWVSEGKYDILA